MPRARSPAGLRAPEPKRAAVGDAIRLAKARRVNNIPFESGARTGLLVPRRLQATPKPAKQNDTLR
eukprot:9481960-Pyramimonas_sp.AAC.1